MLSVPEAAQQLGVSPKTVRRWIRAGKIPAALTPGPSGHQWLISEADITRVQAAEPAKDPASSSEASPAVVTEALAHLQTDLSQQISAQHDDLLTQMTVLRQEIEALRQQQQSGQGSWWPWRKRQSS